MDKKKGIWISNNTFLNFEEKRNTSLSEEVATRKNSATFYNLGMYLPNPDPVLKKLNKDIEVYREIMFESRTGGCILSRKSGTKSLNWEISRGKAKSTQAKTIQSLFESFNLDKIIDELLDAFNFGFQPLEVNWSKIIGGGKLWPKNIIGKPPEWFCFDEENNLRFKSKTEPVNGELLPDYKFLCPQYQSSYDNPYGISGLSKCFWPVTFKKGGLKFWVTFTEKYGMPFLIGRHRRGIGKTEIDEMADMLEKMIQDAICVIPDDANIEFKESPFKASSANIYKELINTCNDEIAISIVGQTLTTSVSEGGNYATGKVHAGVRDDIVLSDKKLAEEIFNQLIHWVSEINYSASNEIPKFIMWADEEIDLELAQRDETNSRSGVKFTKKYFMKAYNYEEDDIEVSNTTQPSGQFAENQIEAFPPDEIMENITPDELQKIAEDMLSPIIDLIQNGNSYEDILEKLTEQYPLMKAEGLMNLLEKASFLSDTMGRVDVKNE